MKYKFYSASVIVLAFAAVTVIYFLFGNKRVPQQGKIDIERASEVYEMDEEILKLEHGDPS